MSGLRNRARCRNWRASHRLLEYPSETRRFQNEDQQSIRRDAQGSEATWPMTKPSAFSARAAGPFPQALVSPHCCWKALPSAARRLKGRSEEHTSELQSLMRITYAVFFLKK